MVGLEWKIRLKWMIWGYLYFRKLPYWSSDIWSCTCKFQGKVWLICEENLTACDSVSPGILSSSWEGSALFMWVFWAIPCLVSNPNKMHMKRTPSMKRKRIALGAPLLGSWGSEWNIGNRRSKRFGAKAIGCGWNMMKPLASRMKMGKIFILFSRNDRDILNCVEH